jgi:thioredoxin 1
MKSIVAITLFTISAIFYSCSSMQSQSGSSALSATQFADKMKELPAAVIIDVRTPDEFSKGHIQNAQNFDWNGSEFDRQIETLDKSQPVFVYCLSGGRSASAASKMRSVGFQQVFELTGGMMKWRGANLPETTDNAVVLAGMSKVEFDKLLVADKIVLVDFYADWCAPCKKMKPYLEEISTEMASTVTVIRINADDHKQLCQELKIDGLPVLQVYKNKSLSWSNVGFIEKAEVVKQLQ